MAKTLFITFSEPGFHFIHGHSVIYIHRRSNAAVVASRKIERGRDKVGARATVDKRGEKSEDSLFLPFSSSLVRTADLIREHIHIRALNLLLHTCTYMRYVATYVHRKDKRGGNPVHAIYTASVLSFRVSPAKQNESAGGRAEKIVIARAGPR